MAKLSLNPKPTFFAVVKIPIAGGEEEEVGFTFKYRNRKQFPIEFSDPTGPTTPEDIRLIAEGWDLDDEFTDENIQKFIDLPWKCFEAIYETYLRQLRGDREKN